MEDPIGTQIAGWAWSQRDEFAKTLARIYRWVKGEKDPATNNEPKSGILIVGSGGTGKTTLGKLLSGTYDFLFDVPADYSESLGSERLALRDHLATEVLVLPGQENRRDSTWGEAHRGLASGDCRGVILISSFGFHSLGDLPIKNHKLHQGVDKETFIHAYLEDRRNQELFTLRELLPHLAACPSKVWLLSLITKEDLWWSKRRDVDKHFRDGEYSGLIQELSHKLDSKKFRHELLLTSLVISNLVTSRGERLKPNTEGYDHVAQVKSLRRLFETVDALRKWEQDR